MEKIMAGRVPGGREFFRIFAQSRSKKFYFRFGQTSSSTLSTGISTATATSTARATASSTATATASSPHPNVPPSIVVSSVVTTVLPPVSTHVVPSVFSVSSSFIPSFVTTCAPPIIVPSVVTSVGTSLSTTTIVTSAVLPVVSVAMCRSISTSVIPSVSSTSVVSSALSSISSILPVTSALTSADPFREEDWETVGTVSRNTSQVGLLEDGLPLNNAITELERTGEQMICERTLRQQNMGGLPVFLNMSFEEICHQASQDGKIIVLVVMSRQGNDSHLARLLSGISEANDVYFWLGIAESINGRQVKQKFGDNNKDSEVFVVAPSTSPLNPVLVDRFSGQSLQDLRAIREALERGEAALGSLRSDRDREYQRRDLLLQQNKEMDESLRRDKQKKQEDDETRTSEMEEDMSKERAIREARHKRVLKEDKSGWHIIVKMPNNERISRYIKKKSCYQAVYDWVGHSDDRPLFFTLHGGGGVKRLEDPVEGHCMLHLQEREEEEMLSLLDSEVSLRGSLPKGTEDLSSTLPDERRDDDAIRDVGPSEAKRPKSEADVTEKGENNEKTKKKRKRRKKAKNVAGNDGNE